MKRIAPGIALSFMLLFGLLFAAPELPVQAASVLPESDESPQDLNQPMAYSSTMLALGYGHACALTTGGDGAVAGGVKCWGLNEHGQLGIGTTLNSLRPVDVNGLTTEVVAITAGWRHTCALTTAGGVKCWGLNNFGQIGDGSTTNRLTPVDVSGLTSGVVAIAAGEYHTCALNTQGGVKCWGQNYSGQLGDGSTTNRTLPVDVSSLTGSGAVSVRMIAANGSTTCAVTISGGAKCWGINENGQLGNGTITTSPVPVDVSGLSGGVIAVTVGTAHACAIIAVDPTATTGALKCWGGNQNGQLGTGTTAPSLVPIGVNGLASGVVSVTAGDYHTCVVTTSDGNATTGGIKCWGYNIVGQVGNGSNTNQLVPVDVIGLATGMSVVAAGQYTTCSLTGTGGVKCWGGNPSGQLGNGTTSHSVIPVDTIGLNGGITAIVAGSDHTCALTSGGGVKCWGANSEGQLGNNSRTNRLSPDRVTNLDSGVVAITAGEYHTCALTSAGGARCWGYNYYGQLGNSNTASSLVPVNVTGLTSGVTAIAGGRSHTCALTSSGGVKCWGDNYYGQLGNGSTMNSPVAVDVTGLTSGVTAITAGSSHTCALTSSGGVKCWGDNYYGQLGDSTNTTSHYPVDVTGLTSGISSITAGRLHTCAVTTGGGVKCWGWNSYGQLGNNLTINSAVPVDVSGLSSGVSAVAAGYYHNCALITEDGGITGGALKCWGRNDNGQLGTGSITSSLIPVDTSGLSSGVRELAGGRTHTCAATTGGGVKCWGGNDYGQLGDNSTTQRLSYVQTSGLYSTVFPIVRLQVNPAVAGQPVRFTANVLGDVDTPDGLVIFRIDDVNLGSAVPLVDGSVISAAAALSRGAHMVRVIYTSDSNYQTGASAGAVQVVEMGATTTMLASSTNPAVYGQSVTFTATVRSAYEVPTGVVVFREDGMIIPDCGMVTLSAGHANCIAPSLEVGTHIITAEYSGSSDYITSSGTLAPNQQVIQHTPLITWMDPSVIVYGTPLGSTQLNAVADVEGTFTYDPVAGTVLDAGTHTLRVDFNPTDSIHYTPVLQEVNIHVFQATPHVTWQNPLDITYGTALGPDQFNAAADIPGEFEYTPEAGTILPVGSHILRVDFNPTDEANYTTTFAEVNITVTQAIPEITWASPANIVYGTPLSGIQLNASARIPGEFIYTPMAGTVLVAGAHTLRVDFTPADETNYSVSSKEVSISVTKATPVINWGDPVDIYRGTELSDAQLNATANIPGEFKYSPAAGTILEPGIHTLRVDFNPEDADNYNTTFEEVTLIVINRFYSYLPVISK